MFQNALKGFVEEIVMSLAVDLWKAVRNAKDPVQATVKVRGVLKARLHEEIHNAMARALR